jgi:AcrR family transcriptional regulator
MKPAGKRRLGRPRIESQRPGTPPTPERILQAAEDLFCEAGFSAASLSAIAERADLTSGAIYAHFDSKADLLLAVVRRALEASPLNDLAGSNPEPEDASPIPGLVSMYADPERRRLRRLAVEVHAAAVQDKSVADLLTQGNRRVADAFRKHIDLATGCGEFDHSDHSPSSDHIARFLLILTMGLSHLDTLDPDLIGDRDFQTWLEQVVAGVLARSDMEVT